ncbi:MAG: nicotinate (nicotinamide) nucleotide adenylyltransferase [Victivallales bacterium]|nr:nicotinate (nicotinamide) nucleotide adenylyltransferase [Victivallales bacterium]
MNPHTPATNFDNGPLEPSDNFKPSENDGKSSDGHGSSPERDLPNMSFDSSDVHNNPSGDYYKSSDRSRAGDKFPSSNRSFKSFEKGRRGDRFKSSKDRFKSDDGYKSSRDRYKSDGDDYKSSRDRFKSDDGYKSSRDRYKSDDDGYRPSRDRYKSDDDGYRSSRDRNKSDGDGYRPSRDRYKSDDDGYKSSRDRFKSDDDGYRPSRDRYKSDDGYKSSRDRFKSDDGYRPPRGRFKSSDDGFISSDDGFKPYDDSFKPSEHFANSDRNRGTASEESPALPYARPHRIAIFGGSFDPIHNGHLMLAQTILDKELADEILFIPARIQPLKPDGAFATPEQRLEMLRLALEDNPAFSYSNIELQRKDEVSYTYDTINVLSKVFPDCKFSLLIGMDSLRTLTTWYRAPELIQHFDFIIYPRPGVLPPPMPDLEQDCGLRNAYKLFNSILPEEDLKVSSISATAIREAIAKHKPIDSFVPEAVAKYIQDNNLYGY